MAFPMMPQAQWDLVRKMGPDELNKAAMGEYQAQGISPVFALARIKEETALAAAFEAQAKKQQQEEQAKIQGVPVGDIPFTVAEGVLRERGITGVDPSAGREMSPEQMAALQGGIAGGQPMGMEGPPVGMEGPPPMMEGQPPGMGGQPPMMAYGGGLIPGYHSGGPVHPHGLGPDEHMETEAPLPYEEIYGSEAGGAFERLEEKREKQRQKAELDDWLALGRDRPALADWKIMSEADRSGIVPAWEDREAVSGRGMATPKVSAQDVLAFADREDVSREEALDLFYPKVFLPTTGYEPPGLREAVLTGSLQVPDPDSAQVPGATQPPSAQVDDVVDISGVRVDVVPPQVPDPDDTTLPQVPNGVGEEDIEYSRYSDPTVGPFNAMSQLSENISAIQQAYGPDKQALDAMRRGNLQQDLIDLQRTQTLEDEAEEARRKDITGIKRLQEDTKFQANAATNRVRGTLARARINAAAQQARIEATRAMTKGQLEDHAFKRDATGKSQLEEYRDATNRRADAALFAGVGDVLRGSPRDQRFGDVISTVGDIRGDALTATQKIQDDLLTAERDDIETLHTSETLANKATRESQNYLLDQRKSSDTEITRIAEGLLEDRATSEEKVRSIEKALRDDDIAQLRLLISAERAIRDFPTILAEEAISREVDPLIADFARMASIFPAEAGRIGSRSLGVDAAQSTIRFENILRELGSPESALALKRQRDTEIKQRYDRLAEGGRRTAAQAAAEKAEMDESQDAYETTLKKIELFRVMSAEMLAVGNPEQASTTVRTNVSPGLPNP